MSKRTQASKPGDFGVCVSCNDYLVAGERGNDCSDPACPPNGHCENCLVECECGKMICEAHRYLGGGLVLCEACDKLERMEG